MTAPAGARPRIESVDVVRGIIMILMALDHTRDFFGIPGQNPVDLTTASTALFFTRWVTHICAPTFFLLTGTGAYLSLRKQTRAQLSGFLFTRGLWLIFLEVTVLRCLAYQFNFDYRVTMLLVIWALGWAMIVLVALVRLPTAAVASVGVVLIAVHNAFDGVRSLNPLWRILHAPGLVLNTPEHVVFVAYPLVPWIGVTAVGFALGAVFSWEPERRRAFLWRAGLALTVAFIAVRALNVYGDPIPWSAQRTPWYTVLSFLNATKYPPSLEYLLMTLGPALLLLYAVDAHTPRLLRPAMTYGRVPFFYYAVHFALIHVFAVIVCAIRYGSAHWMLESPDLGHYPFSAPPGWGYTLPIVYLVWVTVIACTYPLCRWFAALKQRRSDRWLSYL